MIFGRIFLLFSANNCSSSSQRELKHKSKQRHTMKAAFSVATIAAVCALGAAAAPSMEKRDDDWAYFCDGPSCTTH